MADATRMTRPARESGRTVTAKQKRQLLEKYLVTKVCSVHVWRAASNSSGASPARLNSHFINCRYTQDLTVLILRNPVTAQRQRMPHCRLKMMVVPTTLITVPVVWARLLLAMQLPLPTNAATSFTKHASLIGCYETTIVLAVVANFRHVNAPSKFQRKSFIPIPARPKTRPTMTKLTFELNH